MASLERATTSATKPSSGKRWRIAGSSLQSWAGLLMSGQRLGGEADDCNGRLSGLLRTPHVVPFVEADLELRCLRCKCLPGLGSAQPPRVVRPIVLDAHCPQWSSVVGFTRSTWTAGGNEFESAAPLGQVLGTRSTGLGQRGACCPGSACCQCSLAQGHYIESYS